VTNQSNNKGLQLSHFIIHLGEEHSLCSLFRALNIYVNNSGTLPSKYQQSITMNQRQFTQQNTESKHSTLSLIKMHDINIRHQNTSSQLKTAQFHITFEFELTELQDQYSYDHKHLGVFARYLGLICQQTIKQTLSRLLRTNSEVPEFHKVL